MLTAQDGNMGVTKNHLGLLTFYLGQVILSSPEPPALPYPQCFQQGTSGPLHRGMVPSTRPSFGLGDAHSSPAQPSALGASRCILALATAFLTHSNASGAQ